MWGTAAWTWTPGATRAWTPAGAVGLPGPGGAAGPRGQLSGLRRRRAAGHCVRGGLSPPLFFAQPGTAGALFEGTAKTPPAACGGSPHPLPPPTHILFLRRGLRWRGRGKIILYISFQRGISSPFGTPLQEAMAERGLGGNVRTSQVALRATYSVEFRVRETRGKVKTYTSQEGVRGRR